MAKPNIPDERGKKEKKAPLPKINVPDPYTRPPEKLNALRVSLTAILDTARERKDKTYSVRLRIIFDRIPLYFTVPVNTTVDVYEKIAKSLNDRSFKLTSNEKQSQKTIYNYLNTAFDVISEQAEFSFPAFKKEMERRLFPNNASRENDVFSFYSQIINKNRSTGALGNASNYELSLRSIKKFLEYKKGKEPKSLKFPEITPAFLEEFERYMLRPLLDEKGEVIRRPLSRTTVSMYIRALRTVFNTAIDQKEITSDLYPFGRRKYTIPAPRGVKKALTQEQIKKLFEAVPRTKEQETAKDFWFFSYACNGMNVKDIALLTPEDVQGDRISYFRAKTINTSKADQKPVIVFLNDYSIHIIEKYSKKKPGKYIFPILEEIMTEEEIHAKIKNFTRFINQHLQKLAAAEGLPNDISTYWARHSFASLAVRRGASMEFISEALNHHDLKTTQNYMAGFEEDIKKEFANNLMNF